MGKLFILVLFGHFLESKLIRSDFAQLKKIGISIYGCSLKEIC